MNEFPKNPTRRQQENAERISVVIRNLNPANLDTPIMPIIERPDAAQLNYTVDL